MKDKHIIAVIILYSLILLAIGLKVNVTYDRTGILWYFIYIAGLIGLLKIVMWKKGDGIR